MGDRLIQTALGDSPLKAWNPEQNGTLYRNMSAIVRAAGGRIRGVLWYQGCSDCNPEETARSPWEIPHVTVIPAIVCTLTDEIHNSPAGNLMIGERMERTACESIRQERTAPRSRDTRR